MTEVITLTEADITARVERLDATYPDFRATWETPGCSCCKPDWNTWGVEKIDAWSDYRSLRWLRGDVEPLGAGSDD